MKLDDLFSALKAHWPEQMDLSKAEVLSNGGFLCWEQVRLEEKIIDSIGGEGLLAAGVWPFHQALAKVSRELCAQDQRIVSRNDVRIQDFEHYLLDGLSNDSWALERAEYRKHN
jgi:hypothetical protein